MLFFIKMKLSSRLCLTHKRVTQKYRNSKLIKKKSCPRIGSDRNWPILRIFWIGSDLKKWYCCIPIRGIESLKYVWEFHTPVWYCGDISTHWNVTLNETNCDWLFDISVKRPHGWALANKCCHLFQTFSRQSEGLATRVCLSSNKHSFPISWFSI